MQPRIVIRRQRPWVIPVLVLSVLLTLGLSGWAMFRLGQSVGDPEAPEVQGKAATPEEERRRLLRELRAAREEVVALKSRETFNARSNEIDAQACRSLRESVASCESTAAKLREELSFYRTIVSPEKGRSGVRVQDVELRAGAAPELWRYELLLVRSVRNQSHAAGRVELQVEGQQEGRIQVLDVSPLPAQGAGATGFSFRYFQELQGELRLPPGFRPERLRVTLVVQGDREHKEPVVETFEWSRVVRDEARSPT